VVDYQRYGSAAEDGNSIRASVSASLRECDILTYSVV
jgi:hypothetical protein